MTWFDRMNKVAAFALRRKNSILSMSEKLFCPPQPLRLVWVTPAYAGKSSASCASWGPERDHPRVCGEKGRRAEESVPRKGSPPRVRGKVNCFWKIIRSKRITPACAGKRRGGGATFRCRWDHPRVCGEKQNLKKSRLTNSGSPPRVRGKVCLLTRFQK